MTPSSVFADRPTKPAIALQGGHPKVGPKMYWILENTATGSTAATEAATIYGGSVAKLFASEAAAYNYLSLMRGIGASDFEEDRWVVTEVIIVPKLKITFESN